MLLDLVTEWHGVGISGFGTTSLLKSEFMCHVLMCCEGTRKIQGSGAVRSVVDLKTQPRMHRRPRPASRARLLPL